MSLLTLILTYIIPIRQSYRLIGSFNHDSSFHSRNHDENNIFSHDLNTIIDDKYSHSPHDEDEALKVPPLQVDKISHAFDKLETYLTE